MWGRALAGTARERDAADSAREIGVLGYRDRLIAWLARPLAGKPCISVDIYTASNMNCRLDVHLNSHTA